MKSSMEGMRVLVTAGAGGIGLGVARAFANEGARVHVCDVDENALKKLVSADTNISGSLCDVSDRAQVNNLFDEVSEKLSGLDCLVNNAGIAGPTGRVDEVPPEDWDKCLAIGLTGQFNCARMAVKYLSASGNPSIINMSSAAGKFGFPLRSAYAATKWGVVGFTKSLAIELGPLSIRVNAILPGIVDGDRIRNVLTAKADARGTTFEDLRDQALAQSSIREMIQPSQIADLITFIASAKGRTISGQALSIDGDLQAMI